MAKKKKRSSQLNEPERLLTAQEVATYLGLKTPETLTIWRSTRRYPLRWVKVGNLVRYRREDVEAFVAARTRGEKAK